MFIRNKIQPLKFNVYPNRGKNKHLTLKANSVLTRFISDLQPDNNLFVYTERKSLISRSNAVETSQIQRSGFDPELRFSDVCVGFLQILQFPPTFQKNLPIFGLCNKLPLVVCVSSSVSMIVPGSTSTLIMIKCLLKMNVYKKLQIKREASFTFHLLQTNLKLRQLT